MSSQPFLQVKVRDTEKMIYEGSVDRISSYNEVGPFDIYPTHANFISILRREIAFYQKNQKIKELKIEQAVLKVKKDSVNIFLGIEMLLVDEESKAAPPQQATEKK